MQISTASEFSGLRFLCPQRICGSWDNQESHFVRFAKHFVPFGKAHLYTMRETGAAARVFQGFR